jgi:hypothetical protein
MNICHTILCLDPSVSWFKKPADASDIPSWLPMNFHPCLGCQVLPKAHVTLQGSARRATGISGISDLDFLVEGCKVTSQQRKLIEGHVLQVLSHQVPDAGCYLKQRKQVISVLPGAHGINYPGIDIAFERCAVIQRLMTRYCD